ncbi:SafA/ExsA family spore coat assembly protein [Ornithinibacillus sp. 179-J 7C1 HS]|uniref:SafA/ExsA family spore coat assembly protein n=1 Tax=Ornithinibacillus sp. 179-J 7C1 HS TaxID=3142384 RepID=UPI0039A2CEB6
MKIHIVQKGDTMWELSQKYGVDFEELKAANSHIASPDMIMPGMKIRIPTTAKTVKKEAPVKEVKKEQQVETPYKDISPKPIPVIKEDDEKPVMQVKPEVPMPEMPQIPQMTMPLMQSPTIEQEQHTTYMTFNFPESSESKESHDKPVHHEKKTKEQPASFQPIYEPMHHPVQMIPCFPVHPCHHVHPCWGGHPVPLFPMQLPAHVGQQPVMPMVQNTKDDCGCGGPSIPQMGETFDPNMFQGQQGMPQFDPSMFQGQQGMPQFDPSMFQGQQGVPQINPSMFQSQQGMPQFDPNFAGNQVDGQQSEANVTFPTMPGYPENGFPTPPGFGELRVNEEESSD